MKKILPIWLQSYCIEISLISIKAMNKHRQRGSQTQPSISFKVFSPTLLHVNGCDSSFSHGLLEIDKSKSCTLFVILSVIFSYTK